MRAGEEVERIRYRFVGKVQHRGFRYACVMCAERSGVLGWVRNERDGAVTAEAQGTARAQLDFVRRVTALVAGYGDGWSIAREDAVELVEGETRFGVRRT